MGFATSPPGFVGLNPHLPVRIYHRHLPHWRQDGATYVVTFRQADSLPAYRIAELKQLRREWERRNLEPRSEAAWKEYAKGFTRRVDGWLDEGHGSCCFSNRKSTEILASAVTKFHNQRFHVGAYAIMPNHCHLIIRPFTGFAVEDRVGAMKKYSTIELRKHENLPEPFWMQESHDRIIRDENHLAKAIEYIGLNPAKAGLGAQASWRCWIAEDWREASWVFDPSENIA